MAASTSKRLMPAEWGDHHGTWLSWPHNHDTWPGVLRAAEAAMVKVAAALAEHEMVYINVLDDDHAGHVGELLSGFAADSQIRLEQIPTNDAWIRDYGSIIVRDPMLPTGFAAIDFDYNAWGGKYPPFDQDQAVAAKMAARLELPSISVGMVLEGGSVDVNGAGLGLVTEQCLLNPNRNPSMHRKEIESRLTEFLGVTEFVWLADGVTGDDTDGHIDNLARFVDERRVVAILTSDAGHPDFAALRRNRRRLNEFRDSRGRGLEVINLPLPDPVVHRGERLPASYANFYIANELVLMPAYQCAADATAAGILADCFPGRSVVPIDCRPLIVGLGALHCLTQQIPVIVSHPRPQREDQTYG